MADAKTSVQGTDVYLTHIGVRALLDRIEHREQRATKAERRADGLLHAADAAMCEARSLSWRTHGYAHDIERDLADARRERVEAARDRRSTVRAMQAVLGLLVIHFLVAILG